MIFYPIVPIYLKEEEVVLIDTPHVFVHVASFQFSDELPRSQGPLDLESLELNEKSAAVIHQFSLVVD